MRLILLLSITTAAASFAAEPLEDYRFKSEVLVENMPQPMQLDIAPDGRIFFNEYNGKLRIYHPDTRKVVEAGTLNVYAQNENGLLGMALDPQFAKTGWIYLLHSPKDFDGQIISRFSMKGDLLDLASRKDLLKFAEQRKQCCHHAGALRFGPDGCLYASSGDNTNPFASDGFSPHDERPDRDPWDAQKSSANTNDLRGKILRIRPKADGTYEIPKGNLFPPGTANTRPEIFAMGFRNPWRFSIDQKTGIVYAGDVGPDAGGTKEERGPSGFDTVNQIRKPGYFGWPYSRGNQTYTAFNFEANKPGAKFDALKPLNASPNNTGLKTLPPVEPPMIWYPYGDSKEFPALGGGGRTACAGPVFHFKPSFTKTEGFPEHFDGCLLFFDWQRPFIKWARLDKNSALQGIEPFTDSVRVTQGLDDESGRITLRRPVDMMFGAEGALYVLDYGETWGVNKDSRLLKITYQRGNLAPVAKARAVNSEGREPLTVELSSKGSRDPEGSPLKFEWRLQPGDRLIGTEADPKVTIQEPGSYRAELRVTDAQGASASTFVAVMVGNTPPALSFESPKDGDFFTPGQPIPYKVSVHDAEDGDSSEKAAEFGARTLVSATKIGAKKSGDVAPGLALMKGSDCFNCHTIQEKLVGPALLEVANKYRNQPGAETVTVERIVKGSTGVWGQVGMLPHPQHTEDELHIMVRWIFSLEADASFTPMARAVEGEIASPSDATSGCILSVTYTDGGRAPAGPLSAKSSVTLRSRRIEAESGKADKAGALESGSASGKNALGHINDGSSVQYAAVPMQGIQSVTVRVACESSHGGKIVMHTGSKDGAVIGEVDVTTTGG